MAPMSETLGAYERRRLENISRNAAMMSALMVKRKAADLSSVFLKPKRQRTKPPKLAPSDAPRRSLRTRGIHPKPPPPPAAAQQPYGYRPDRYILTREALVAGPHGSDAGLIAAISGSEMSRRKAKGEGFDPRSELVLRPENVAKLLTRKTTSVRFMPLVDRTVLAVGNSIGNLGFWDADSSEGDGDGVYVYQPHCVAVSGIVVHPFSPRKIFTSSYDGFICLMDIEKESFNLILSSHHAFHSICQRPNDVHSLYIGEGAGMLKVWDVREGKSSSFWGLHDDMINTIDFNPGNEHLMVTSSNDGFAHLWDLRSMNKDGPESINSVSHKRTVHSAYFSPSGNYLATTSSDNNIGIASGANFKDRTMISHNNWAGKSMSTFRAIWGWDDSYLYTGHPRNAFDIISTTNKAATVLTSPEMASTPCWFAAHPYMVGSLACTTFSGKVFLWTKE